MTDPPPARISGPRVITLLIALLSLISSVGCAGKSEKKAWMKYADRIAPVVNEARLDDFVAEWGMPDRRLELDEGYACQWYFSKGTRSVGFAYFISIGSARQAYDDVLLIFDDENILRDWHVECKR